MVASDPHLHGGKDEELRAAHDVLAEFYAEQLADLMAQKPADRAVLRLFADLVTAFRSGTPTVADIGCGSGRLAPCLGELGMQPHGIDMSSEMIRVARRDFPAYPFTVGDARALPLPDNGVDAAVAWYSLMYLTPQDRPHAFAELARVIRPGGYVTMAFKVGNDQVRRGGEQLGLGIGFDIYWHSPDEVSTRLTEAGLTPIFTAMTPATDTEPQPQGYVLARADPPQA